MSELPRDELARIEAYCDRRPQKTVDRWRVSAHATGHSVTIVRARAPKGGESGSAPRETRVAQLRFEPALDEWTLYWSDRDGRWHRFEEAPPGKVDEVIEVLDRDPTGVFWG